MRYLRYILAAAAALAAPAAHASDANVGYVGYLYAFGGTIVFQQSGARTGTVPGCASGTPAAEWEFDGSTATGQAMLSTLLTAFSLHKQITVRGTGSSCVAGLAREDVTFILMLG